MSNSEIFDNYIKIAEESGIISLAEEEKNEPKESAKLKKYKKSPYPRVGSDDISTIEALYGVKPDSYLEYEYNILEEAHPKPVVIAPSYDKINALVENDNERANIMHNIVSKTPSGMETHHRYAKKDLVLALVRIANDMDNSNNHELRILADKCIDGLSVKKNIKIAIAPLLLIVGAGAAILAGIWMFSHLDDPDKGLMANIENALNELEDLRTNSWYEGDVDETVQRDVAAVVSQVTNLQKYVKDFIDAMDTIYKPISLTDKAEVSKFKQSVQKEGQEAAQKTDAFVRAIDPAVEEITKAINNFKSSFYQHQHSKQGPVDYLLGGGSGWIQEAIHGRWGLIANDFISAVNALDTLKSSLEDARKLAYNFDAVKEKKEEELKASMTEFKGQQEPGADADEENQEFAPEEEIQEEPAENKKYEDLFEAAGIKPTKQHIEWLKSLKNQQ